MTSHLEESLQRDFDRIRDLITKMAELARRNLLDCASAFEKRDRQLSSIVILRDQRIDQLEKEIDRLCLEFLLRHQPAGGHLRFAYAALQVNFELERVGDYAESIARQILKLIDLNIPIPTSLFTDISSAAISMLRNAVMAFVRQDPELAAATAQIEEQVDVLRNQINSELTHRVQSNQLPLAALSPLMTIARRFERVTDQAKSICQETIYICTGEYGKHQDAQAYRVLFVDDYDGGAARMAASIGRALKEPEFVFAAASVDPRPLHPDVVAFLRRKGLDLAEGALPRLRDLTDFNSYQVVIALSAAVKKQLPGPARKTVHLEWPLPDLSAAADAGGNLGPALERVHAFLTSEILKLVSAILGEERPQR